MKAVLRFEFHCWLLLSAVTRAKADNPLYGSSLIEYVSGVRIVWVSKDLFVASYVLEFAGFKIFCVYSDTFFFFKKLESI